MADDSIEAESGEESSEGGGGTPWLLVIGAAVAALLLGVGGAYFVLQPQAEPKAAAEETVAEPQVDPAVVAAEVSSAEFRERLYSLEPFVVNVTGDGYSRYLKIKVDLEGDSPKVKEEIDARLSQVRDAMIVLLSSKRLSDITDFEGKALLKEDILLRVNDLLEGGEVQSVLFTEFVVQ